MQRETASNRTQSTAGTRMVPARNKICAAASALVGTLLGTHSVLAQTWNQTATGTYYWNNAANWIGGVPNSASANVNLSVNTSTAGQVSIYEEGQRMASLIIGDNSASNFEYLYADPGAGSPDLSLGSSGGTAPIYVSGVAVSGGGASNGIPLIFSTINMNGANLHIISNNNYATSNSLAQTLYLEGGFVSGANLEITHAYVGLENPDGPAALSYTGSTTLDGGYATLEIGYGTSQLPSATAVNISDSTDVLSINSSPESVGSISGPGTVYINQTTLTTTVNNNTFSGKLAGDGELNISGGTLTLTGNSVTSQSSYGNFDGSFLINSSLSIANDNSLGTTQYTGSGNVSFGSTFVGGMFAHFVAGNLIATATTTSSRNMVLGIAGGSFVPAAGTDYTVSGIISGSNNDSSVIVNGAGTLTLTGANTYYGGAILNSGTLQISSDSNLGSYAAGPSYNAIGFFGGTLQLSGSDTTSHQVYIATGYTANISSDPGTYFNFNNLIYGNGGLSKAGSGSIQLSYANTYSGGTTISAGAIFAGPIVNPAAGASPLGTGPVTMGPSTTLVLSGQLNSISQQTISATGFNYDVIVPKGTSPTGYQAAVNSSFDDSPITTNGYVFYEQGYIGPNKTNGGNTGLPTGGLISSASTSGVNFQLQPYTANNVLLVPSGGFNYLTLSPRGAFSELNVLAAACDGAAAVTVYVAFNDSTSLAETISVPDWFTGAPAAYSVNGRLSLADGSFEVASGNYPRLFEFDIPIPSYDQSKLINEVEFANTGSGTLGVFALSGNGALVSPTQSLPNNLTVNGTVSYPSYIELDGSPTSTMGTLTIGTNCLDVATTQGSATLTFANTVLNGSAYINALLGTTVNLGPVSGTGSLSSSGNVSSSSFPKMTMLQINSNIVSLTSHAPGSVKSVLQLGTLSIAGSNSAWSGTLDLTNNSAVISSGNLATITNQIASGYANGSFNGTGITSSAAAADTTHLTALGVILNNDGAGSPLYSTFDGAPAPTNSVIISFTYFGDTNLNGTVDGGDYSRIDNGYLAHASGWTNGDFNYDGTINGSDFTLIDNSYNRQGAVLSDETAVVTTQIAAPSAVPEPSSILLAMIPAVAMLRRRCNRFVRQNNRLENV